MQNLDSGNEVTQNYREASINKVRLEFLDHRSKLNESVLAISQEMSVLNAQAIFINRRIMETNEGIKEFNATMIAENTRLLSAAPTAPTPQVTITFISNMSYFYHLIFTIFIIAIVRVEL